ncbi:MAG TPA: right-handed parallel beta-helix repeat-containing protein, partial [candidate division Zixibacteria bacterium]|nr:right-handed parallel beta-helix repeat-containing protein [candidate division Zixibacteria bacterium]
RFEGLSAPDDGQWAYTGAVTFYQSPAEFHNCVFVGNTCEDALNCVLSPFRVVACEFVEIFADALDADFSNGAVERSAFVNCGNDAIDVSGSELRVADVVITAAKDKGVSVGEGSAATISNLRIRRSEIALAAKDLSRVTIDGLSIDSCRVGFTIYQKKSEFGPAEVTADDVSLTAVEIDYLLENTSSLKLNGAAVAANEDRVKDQLYGVKYGKSSR